MSNVEKFDMKGLTSTAMMYTSFGDMGRLGLLEGFRPSASNDTITVENIDFSLRTLLPSSFYTLYEYDDQLHLRISVGEKFGFGGEMNIRTRVIRELFEDLF